MEFCMSFASYFDFFDELAWKQYKDNCLSKIWMVKFLEIHRHKNIWFWPSGQHMILALLVDFCCMAWFTATFTYYWLSGSGDFCLCGYTKFILKTILCIFMLLCQCLVDTLFLCSIPSYSDIWLLLLCWNTLIYNYVKWDTPWWFQRDLYLFLVEFDNPKFISYQVNHYHKWYMVSKCHARWEVFVFWSYLCNLLMQQFTLLQCEWMIQFSKHHISSKMFPDCKNKFIQLSIFIFVIIMFLSFCFCNQFVITLILTPSSLFCSTTRRKIPKMMVYHARKPFLENRIRLISVLAMPIIEIAF